MRQLIILFSVLILPSMACVNRHKAKYLAYLTNDSCKYWYRYNKSPLRSYKIGFCICNDGTFDYYNINDSLERIINNNPVLSKSIWRFLSDSTMELGEKEIYKILSLNDDSLILYPVEFSGSYLNLHRDTDQTTRPVLRSIKDTSRRKNAFPNL